MKTYIQSKSSTQIKAAFNAFLIISALFTLGCSNTNEGIQYYSLNAIKPQASKIINIEKTQEDTLVIINDITLADFLNTGGIVMQVDSHQIQISNQHRWGDKLPKAILAHLITSLSANNNHLYFDLKNSKNTHLANKKLSLSFEQFTIANQQHETVISGYYTIESTLDNTREKTFFDIRQPLSENGYNHAVENFKNSLDELSSLIIKELT
ncbi:PqiC family protein [Colwellia sp. RE-S-Sl-9]